MLENLVTVIGKAKLPDYISNPKGSRQFQQFIKLGSKEQRNCAIEALCKQVPDLATRNIYALLTLEKMITYGLKTDESYTVDKFVKPVMTDRKTVEQLLFHRLGCKYLNKLYIHPSIKPALKKQMLNIILVPRSIELLGESKEKLRQYYLETCKKCVDKELLGLEVIQRLFKQAVLDFPIAEDLAFNEELLAMAADGLPHLLSSRDGVSVVIRLLGIASAKHKKNMIKEMKGKFAEMAKNSVTCVALLRILDCVDDTVLVGKSVLIELVGSDYSVGLDLIQDPSGRMPFLYAMDGLETKTAKYYPQTDKQMLDTCVRKTAMKDAQTRKTEILSKLIPSVLRIVRDNMGMLMKNEYSKDVILALIRTVDDESTRTDLIERAMESLTETADIDQSLVSTVISLLKEYPTVASKPCWANLVASMKTAGSAGLVEIVSGLGSFVVMNLSRKNDSAVAESVKSCLFANKAAINEVETPNKGATILKEELKSIKNASMTWEETVAAFAVSKKRAVVSEEPKKAKKAKTAAAATSETVEGGKSNMFEDEAGDDEDEMWGIVGDDDEFAYEEVEGAGEDEEEEEDDGEDWGMADE